MNKDLLSNENLEKYWKIVKKNHPKLFKNRNNSKRNRITYYMLDLLTEDMAYKELGPNATEEELETKIALMFTIKEYKIILDFVNDKDRDYCVYIWRYWGNGKPFYVGKGKKYRAKNKKSRNEDFKNIVENNHCFYQIYKTNLSEIEALQLENNLINNFRDKGYKLVNKGSRKDTKSII